MTKSCCHLGPCSFPAAAAAGPEAWLTPRWEEVPDLSRREGPRQRNWGLGQADLSSSGQ